MEQAIRYHAMPLLVRLPSRVTPIPTAPAQDKLEIMSQQKAAMEAEIAELEGRLDKANGAPRAPAGVHSMCREAAVDWQPAHVGCP